MKAMCKSFSENMHFSRFVRRNPKQKRNLSRARDSQRFSLNNVYYYKVSKIEAAAPRSIRSREIEPVDDAFDAAVINIIFSLNHIASLTILPGIATSVSNRG